MELTRNASEINKRQAEIIAIREEVAKLRAELSAIQNSHGSTTREMILEVEMQALNNESQRIELAIKHALSKNAEVPGIY